MNREVIAMTMSLRGALRRPAVLAVLFVAAGYVVGQNSAQTTASGADAKVPTVKEIMGKLTKGPMSLTPVIGKELQTAEPPWDTIQPQTQEFAKLAKSMGENNPPKGAKESWSKQTLAFAEAAAALDKAAQAKDKDGALAAHRTITGACMNCHRQHRPMGPGR
ncbi:MAG TPA: hypothetical protein VGZ22_08565 [Isosphaeraceae bacterium]|nr:hypothetical protein [Isosphaeraceae bacterium]